MGLATNSPTKAFGIMFKDLDRWDPTSFHRIIWHWPKELMAPIGSVLRLRREKVDRSRFLFSDLHPITIHFDGTVDHRSIEGNKEYTMDLFFAHPGDIVVAKIDLKNGAVGIIPDDWDNIVVTGHFAIYEPDRPKLVPEYLHLIIQTKFFKNYLWRNKVGAEGRKEVKLGFFESLLIPLPPIPFQRAIVGHWERAQEKINEANQRIERLKQDSEETLLRELGIRVLPPTPRKGAFKLAWKDLERWDTFFYRKDFADLDQQLSQVKSASLGQILNFISRGWNVKDFTEGMFEYIEISSVTKDDGIIGSKTVEVRNAPSRATTLLKEGDIILSTTRPYLGAFAIVPMEYDGCVCSSGFAMADELKTTEVNKDFLLFFLKSSAGLRQLERRMTGGLYPAVVQGELEKIRVPLPPLTLQQKIVEEMKEKEMEIARERKKGEQLTAAVSQEVEEMILGVRSVPKV